MHTILKVGIRGKKRLLRQLCEKGGVDLILNGTVPDLPSKGSKLVAGPFWVWLPMVECYLAQNRESRLTNGGP